MDKRMAGLAIIAVALVSLGIWEFWGRENLSYEDVPVLKDDVQANTVIEKEDIRIKKMESPSPHALSVDDLEWLVGMESAQFVAGGTELYSQYFRQSQFAMGGDTGKEIMCIPKEWLLSFPQTVRRGDKVTFYSGTVRVLEAIVAHAIDGAGQEVMSGEEDRLTASAVVSQLEIIASSEHMVELAKLAGEGARFAVLYS